MAPWWLHSGDDEAWFENETPDTGEKADSPAAPKDSGEQEAHEGNDAQETREIRSASESDESPEAPEVHEKQDAVEAAEGEDAQDVPEAPVVEPASEEDEVEPAEEGAEAKSAEAKSAEEGGEAKTEAKPTKRRRRRRRRRRRKPAAQEPAVAEAAPAPQAVPAAERAPEAEAAPPSPEPMATPAVEADTSPSLDMLRSLVYPLPERSQAITDERKIAMFCDFENIALGVRDSQIKKFDVHLILERLLEKGKIIVKKAYADWERYNEYKKPFHEAAIELIDIPQKYYSGKNSADIKMVVDAMDLCYSKEHLDTFVLVSGDSDFSPLVSKLKENNKYVIGVGVKNSSSSLLIDNCDEFIYYEDIWRDIQRAARLDNLSPKDAEVFGLMLDAMFALNRENKDVLWGSMIKQTMQRKRPSFNEGYYGYRTFSELLEDAQRKNIIRLKRDQRSGNYVVSGLAQPR